MLDLVYTHHSTSVYTAYHSPQIVYIILPSIDHMDMHTIAANETITQGKANIYVMVAQIQE